MWRRGRKDFTAVTVSIVTAHSPGSIDINYSQSFIVRKRKGEKKINHLRVFIRSSWYIINWMWKLLTLWGLCSLLYYEILIKYPDVGHIFMKYLQMALANGFSMVCCIVKYLWVHDGQKFILKQAKLNRNSNFYQMFPYLLSYMPW